MDAGCLRDWVSLQWRFVNTYACKASRHLPEKLATWVPAKLWQLTQAANLSFHGYAELTLSFIQSVVEAFGEAGLERLLEIRARQQIEAYGLKRSGVD